MDLKILRKGYSKLTANERFAAMVSAQLRGDESERAALMQSAPTRVYVIKHHYGLSVAFDAVAAFQMARLLRDAGLILTAVLCANESEQVSDAARIIALRYRTNRAAWAVVCNEYGLNPQAMLGELPGQEILEQADSLAELFTRPELPELDAYTGDLREAIEHLRKEWE